MASQPDRQPKRFWSDREDDLLRQMHDARVSPEEQAHRLGRSKQACAWRRSCLGLVLPHEEAILRRQQGMRAMTQDEIMARRFSLRAGWTTERRKEQAERSRRFCLVKWQQPASEETRAKLASVRRALADQRLDFAPRGHPLREMYVELRRKVGAQEARRMVEAHIRALPPLERQLLAIERGMAVMEVRR